VPKHVQLVFALGARIPSVQGDSGQIQQVLMNLIINATEAIGAKNGHVHIQSSTYEITDQTPICLARMGGDVLPSGCYVCVTVKDDGIGMDNSTLDRIFDPFFSTKGYGRGLGLSATVGIIRQHQGGLDVKSQLGQGSAFQVLLPAAPAMDRPTRAEPVSEAVPTRLEGTVLVVDDEAMLRDVVSEVLHSVGLHVITAENGRQGLEAFCAHRSNISLIVLDMQMPVMNGADTLRELMTIDPNIGVILTSGYSDSTLTNPFINQPSVVFLPKPYLLDTLIKTVTDQIVNRQAWPSIQPIPGRADIGCN
jgi:CheY-like chemotaxis protein